MNMLKAFTEGDPDGNGVNGDTYALSAAGFMGEESPYTNYLPEFYQESYPSFTRMRTECGMTALWSRSLRIRCFV